MKVAIIGFGNIGRIYARSFVKLGLVERNNIFISARSAEKSKEEGFSTLNENPELINAANVIIISVKPQDFPNLIPNLQNKLRPEQVVLSVMAGVTIEQISKALHHPTVVRAMPNSPIEIGMGVTGFCASPQVNLDQIRMVEQLLSTTGRTAFFKNEELMDAVTALSGSGPAYFFYFVQCMIEAGIEMGFEASVSSLLVKQTMLGAFHLLNSSDLPLEDLIKTVASKGGTTEAAFRIFHQGKLNEVVKDGIFAAKNRGAELSNLITH